MMNKLSKEAGLPEMGKAREMEALRKEYEMEICFLTRELEDTRGKEARKPLMKLISFYRWALTGLLEELRLFEQESTEEMPIVTYDPDTDEMTYGYC